MFSKKLRPKSKNELRRIILNEDIELNSIKNYFFVNSNKETLLKQYKEDNWIEESGLSFDELNEKCQAILYDETKTLGNRKVEAISFILNNAQIDIIEEDFFQNKLIYIKYYCGYTKKG